MSTLLGADLEVLCQALQYHQQGLNPLLVTVLKTWGSAPRPAGSLLVITAAGRHAGSVSGGCVEADLFQRCQQGEWQALKAPALIRYGVSQDEAARFGLPCGGQLELLLEPLHDIAHWQDLYRCLQAGQVLERSLNLATGRASLAAPNHSQADAFNASDTVVRKVFGPQWRMLLIGANHLARYVSQFALALDYQVQVCDPREDYWAEWDIPQAAFTKIMPDDAVLALKHYQRTIILTLTHDPKLDDMALMEALNTDAFYIGALGSKLSSDKRRERMLYLGISEANIARLHAPVGMDIGSRTPAEIAIAIMADITKRRNRSD
ncbi:XdhC family protein [uncultured Thiothrix sp.]|uniref:XdhC family protein n=1 Tax=uncultured Thiothrix sp. TaxID=223185 RepID=UPI002620C354|nr:XdhC family protein [uncultured Thiothrix sp.]